MKFGVREITDITLKATHAGQSIGEALVATNAYDPMLFFDSAKTSTVESAVATVYAQGGRGNPRLLAWDGDKTVTFTFEDALMSPQSFAALSGSDLIDGDSVAIHLTEKASVVDVSGVKKVILSGISGSFDLGAIALDTSTYVKVLSLDVGGVITGVKTYDTVAGVDSTSGANGTLTITDIDNVNTGDEVLVDFYVAQTGKNLSIEAGKFGSYYYVEANTLFRGLDGADYPAQFTIPKAKVQSNFTFTMASTGDPSAFTFTMDAFPAKTRFGSKPVLFTLDISDTSSDVI